MECQRYRDFVASHHSFSLNKQRTDIVSYMICGCKYDKKLPDLSSFLPGCSKLPLTQECPGCRGTLLEWASICNDLYEEESTYCCLFAEIEKMPLCSGERRSKLLYGWLDLGKHYIGECPCVYDWDKWINPFLKATDDRLLLSARRRVLSNGRRLLARWREDHLPW